MQNVLLKILFLDIPSLIDSTWRRIDYAANAERVYVQGGDSACLELRPFWKKPPFWFFAVLVFFVSYGPTWMGLCTAMPEPVITIARWLLALAIAGVSLTLAWRYRRRPAQLVDRRFGRVAPGDHVSTARRMIVTTAAYAGPLILLVAFLGVAYSLVFAASHCEGAAFDWRSLASLLLCVAVILLVGVMASRPTSTAWLVCIQAMAIVLLALVHWFVLADSSVHEADHLPYRHVFAFWAPAIVAVLVLAPWVARAMLPPPRPLPPAPAPQPVPQQPASTATSASRPDPDNLEVEAAAFRAWLKQTELFENRTEPSLSGRRLFFALIYGPFYHLLHLLLLPALVALVVEPKWLYASVLVAFVFSVLLLMWGNVAARWDEMNVQIERWFLRGGPLFVSVLVIALAVLRVLQFDYISTILDALPFGTIFGMIVMTYVLFWLVEYWLNRVVAVRLLRVLGGGPDELSVDYPRTGTVPSDIRVLPDGRFVVSHATGRFMAVGTPSAGQPPVAFNSFSLTGLFARVAEQAPTPQERGYAKDIERRAGNYFFSLNAAMLAITAAFIGYYAVKHVYSNNGIDPVVATTASSQAGGPADLAGLLVEKPGQTGPAIVVVGSGGGTRAALYTASVLRGLHRLGVDRDIVLLSGVSGGGVALAYFAAHRDSLVGAPPDGGGPCPDNFAPNTQNVNPWNCFDESMSKPFIEDVLNGATEWRVFSRTALSALLAESFERRLFGNRRLASVERPGLILNVAVVSHPAEASDLLQRTLDAPSAPGAQDKKCGEAERTFQMLSGGRLVFTNLRDSGRFPQRDSRIPDVRLPYHVMQANDVPLATAAALNANFPPVFPSARVRIADGAAGGCPARSYYVTDGGAVENLGLISALYALQSAIDRAPAGRLRPIHIVLAEASAVTYDYGQDRGLSALGGSRERLAGGLTETLIKDVEDQLRTRDQASPKMEFYYLGLPLAFRARGGFGTHWMYAKEYHLNDPRQRFIPWRNYLPSALLRSGKAAVDRKALRELWLALHDPDIRFCDRTRKFESTDSVKVRSWICGDPTSEPDGRDLHMEHWQRLVDRMRAAAVTARK